MNKNFLNAISDIKKQKDRETRKQSKQEKPEKEDSKDGAEEKSEMSSLLQEKLKALAEFKKKITKEEKEPSKWKHDKFKQPVGQEARPQASFPQHQLTIEFADSPGYSKIFPLIKHIKIYVREISDSKVSFNNLQAYSTAVQIFLKAGLKFTNQ